MNNIKNVIQKEEYIALAINKYILQTAKIPKKSTDNTLDWNLLMVDDYLGVNFNKINPQTSNEMKVIFDSNNMAYILGVIETVNKYTQDDNYLYNFYTNKIFRVNTIPPKSILDTELAKGSQVLYNDIQQEIVATLNKSGIIKLSNQECQSGQYFYELRNGKLTYKYCKLPSSAITIYQESPIYLEDVDDLKYIIGNIGDKAYTKDGLSWYEYEYIGNYIWENVINKDKISFDQDEGSVEDKILSYIPDSKDLVLKSDGGCMLANGDIFCWGNNKYKRAGVESHGQLDSTLTPNYINTPVMLKVQIADSAQSRINWYNNPYRVKFEKMAMNDKSVCGISPILNGYDLGERKKYGGDLYCNGYVHSDYFELASGTSGQTETSILRKNKLISSGKENGVYSSSAIYLKDLVMVNDTWALLSDTGTIYTLGSNDKGALGIGSNVFTTNKSNLQIINPNGIIFKKIYALRDIKGFGALDEQNYFWIWGERPNGTTNNIPTILSSSLRFNADAIFTNSKEFVLKGVDNKFYRTYSDISYKDLGIPSSALSVSVYDYNNSEYYVYVNENRQIVQKTGSDIFTSCREKDGYGCTSTEDKTIFSTSFTELNALTNIINNKAYADFSNVSIFETKVSKILVDYGTNYTEDFENGSTTGWNESYIHDGGSITGKFLGRFGKGRIDTTSGSQTLYKTFTLGSEWANKSIKISFDMYEIGSWDGANGNGLEDAFYVYINNTLRSTDIYTRNNVKDTKTGTDLGILQNADNNYIEKHEYSFSLQLDSTGSFKLGFGAALGGWSTVATKDADYTVESFGINNISLSKQIDNTTFTSGTYLENFEDGNHDYWIVPAGPVPFTSSSDSSYTYPIYKDSKGSATKFLGRFNKKSWGSSNYQGESDGTEEVYKVFSFGAENANKQVNIEYDFYRIDSWTYNIWYTINKFFTFINGTKYLTYSMNDNVSSTNLNNIYDTANANDYSFHFTRTEYLDKYGNIRLGFGADILAYGDTSSWGIDNVKFTLTGNINTGSGGTSSTIVEASVPYICSMTGLSSASQMYCWGNVGRSIPILSTALYDVETIKNNLGTINKLFISQESEKNIQLTLDKYNNNGKLFLKYPTYIGGFDYAFYFK